MFHVNAESVVYRGAHSTRKPMVHCLASQHSEQSNVEPPKPTVQDVCELTMCCVWCAVRCGVGDSVMLVAFQHGMAHGMAMGSSLALVNASDMVFFSYTHRTERCTKHE